MEIRKHVWGATVDLTPYETEVLNFLVQDHRDSNRDEQSDFYDDDPSDLREGGKNWYPGMREDQRAYFVRVRQTAEALANQFESVLGPG